MDHRGIEGVKRRRIDGVAMEDAEVEALVRVLKPRIEAELRRAFESDPSLLGESETRRAFDDPSFVNALGDQTQRALEADEEFMAEVERLRREGSGSP